MLSENRPLAVGMYTDICYGSFHTDFIDRNGRVHPCCVVCFNAINNRIVYENFSKPVGVDSGL